MNSQLESISGLNRYWYPLYNIAITASLYTTIALSVERYRALIVKFNSSQRVPENRAKVLIAAASISGFSILLNFPKFFEMQMVDVNVTANWTEQHLAFTDLYNDYYFVLIYDNILGNLILVAVPFISLTFLNLRIFFSLKRRLATYCGREQRLELRTYTVLFSVVLVLAICHSIRIFTVMRLLISLGQSDVQER